MSSIIDHGDGTSRIDLYGVNRDVPTRDVDQWVSEILFAISLTPLDESRLAAHDPGGGRDLQVFYVTDQGAVELTFAMVEALPKPDKDKARKHAALFFVNGMKKATEFTWEKFGKSLLTIGGVALAVVSGPAGWVSAGVTLVTTAAKMQTGSLGTELAPNTPILQVKAVPAIGETVKANPPAAPATPKPAAPAAKQTGGVVAWLRSLFVAPQLVGGMQWNYPRGLYKSNYSDGSWIIEDSAGRVIEAGYARSTPTTPAVTFIAD